MANATTPVIQINEGKVGIGTTNPVGKLNINTGLTGITYDMVNQANGSISFSNNSGGTAAPTITGKSNNNLGLMLVSGTNDTGPVADMYFDVRENNNTDYSTLTSSAYRFNRAGNPLMTILRNGNVGIGTVTPDQALDVEHGNIRIKSDNDGNNGIIMLYDSAGTQAGQVYASAGDLRLYSPNDIIMSPTGNVGIGITGPTKKLDVIDTINGAYGTSTQQTVARFFNKANDATINSAFINLQCSSDNEASNPVAAIGVVSEGTSSNNGSFVAATRSSGGIIERLRINSAGAIKFNAYGAGTLVTDASGNITASSGGGAGGPFLPLAGGTMTGTSGIEFPENFKLKWKDSSTSTEVFNIYSAGGTNYINSGDGTNSVKTKFFVGDGGLEINSNDPVGSIADFDTGGLAVNGNITLSQPTNGSDAILSLISKSAAGNSRTSSIEYDADTEFMYFKNAGTTVATMTSAGKVGIGTTSPDKDLTVGGINPTHGINLRTKSGSSEWLIWSVEQYFSQEGYMRLFYDNVAKIQFRAGDVSYINGGNLIIGGTVDSGEKLQVEGTAYFGDTVSIASVSSYAYLNIITSDAGNGNSGQGLMYLQNTNTATSGGAMVLAIRNDYGTGFGNYIKFFKTGGDTIGEIYANSGRTNVVYSTSSDYRLKEDLKTFKAVDIINQIPVYDFKWKETDFRDYGVLAHEMQAVLPGLVKGDKDGEENQTVDYMAMVPILMQSIKELKAEIELLKQNK